MSAPQSPLVTTFPPSSPNPPQSSFCAAAGRRREVLEKASEDASAAGYATLPDRPGSNLARVASELQKAAMLNSSRAPFEKRSQHFANRPVRRVVARRPTARPATRASPRLGGTSGSTLRTTSASWAPPCAPTSCPLRCSCLRSNHLRSWRIRISIPTAGAAPLLTEKGVEVRHLSGRRADAYFFGASEGARPPPQLELGAK